MKVQIRRRRRGFTLIEVLLVVGILALLAAFAIPRLFSQARKAELKLAEAAIGRNGPLAKALDAYRMDMGKFPDTDEGLAALVAPKGSRGDDKYAGPYLAEGEKSLKDPWQHPYEYRSPGQFNVDEYDLWSRGPDGQDDGGKASSDDIKNWSVK